jgi:hypothetical protein
MISLPDDDPPSIRVSASEKPAIPTISFPAGDEDEENDSGGGPTVSISGVDDTTRKRASVPLILEDLANAPQPTKRGLPRPPSGAPTTQSSSNVSAVPSPSTVSTSSSTSSAGARGRGRRGGLTCGGCQQSIIGRIVSAMGLRWHPQCFKCCVCGEYLEHVSSYEHDGRPYCHLDYHEVSISRIFVLNFTFQECSRKRIRRSS